jgi:hypothetical protein
MRKVRDERSPVSCFSGVGSVREEVWEDSKGQVVRYNLTFISHFLMAADNGRVLGYDNAHGLHHRHFMGTVETYDFESYNATLERFIVEVQALRKRKP